MQYAAVAPVPGQTNKESQEAYMYMKFSIAPGPIPSLSVYNTESWEWARGQG